MREKVKKLVLGKTPTEFSRFLWQELERHLAFTVNYLFCLFGNNGEAVRGGGSRMGRASPDFAISVLFLSITVWKIGVLITALFY